MTINNSTVSGNTANGIGGGIANGGNPSVLNITNSTISGNTSNGIGGGGIYFNQGVTTLQNTIIAGNATTTGQQPDVLRNTSGVTVNSLGDNLIGNTDSFTAITWQTSGATADILNQNARLAPLGFYGGQTLTHALLSTSPAVNAGNTATSPTTDQRGAST